ncbi:MAG: type III polyketide synthase [Acidobacteria bacterium]|nr:type III polyketide synthase [Acidobacteriota bacterium]
MPASTQAFISRIATAVPPHDGHALFVGFLPQLIHDPRHLKIVQRLASRAQIAHRYSVLSAATEGPALDADGFYQPGHFATTAQRMRRYAVSAPALAEQAVSQLLEGDDRQRITHLIVASCTGFAAPGVDLELQTRLGLRSDLERTVIGFMGCYAAFNALKLASAIVGARPDARVVVVCVELCTLHLRDDPAPEKVLGFLQFADGCGAALVTADPGGLRLDRFRCEVVTEARDLICWTIGDHGFDMVLSPDVPQALGRVLPGVLPHLLSDEARAGVRHWMIHPGGRSVLDAVEEALALEPQALTLSRRVLHDFGNMSSATILFVLQSLLDAPVDDGPGVAMAFGPGLTVESLQFTRMVRAAC